MLTFHVAIMAALAAIVQCQRGSFAGKRPIGIPELLNKTTTTVDPLGNRFGEGDSTTERLPVEANGDRDLVDRISKWPIDKQPFWYLNWKALEEQRKNPQTYPQRPSQFGETPNFNAAISNTGIPDSRFGTQNSNSGTQNSNSGTQNSNSGTQNSNSGKPNSNSGTLVSNTTANNSDLGTQTSNFDAHNTATNSGINSGVPSLGNRHGGIDTNSKTGVRRQMNTGSQISGNGHYPHIRYGT